MTAELNNDTLDLTELRERLRRCSEHVVSQLPPDLQPDLDETVTIWTEAADAIDSLITRLEAETAARVAAEGATGEMRKALLATRALVSEGATDGFTDHGWMERLFANQAALTRALLHPQPKARAHD
jgi:hypothetical protein